MTERDFLRAVMEKNMPDEEQVRKNCLEQNVMQRENVLGLGERGYGRTVQWRRKVAMAAVAVIAVVSAGSGICYAATGEGPAAWFQALFEDGDQQAVAQIEEGFAEVNEIRAFDNVELTLNRYFYDRTQGIVVAEMTMKTLDGSSFVNIEDAYEEAVNGWEVSGTMQEWQILCEEDEAQYQIYKEICENLFSENMELSFFWPLDDNSGSWSVEMEDESTYHLYEICMEEDIGGTISAAKEDSVLRVTNVNDEIVAEISMEPTGTLRTCYMNASELEGCKEIMLTGAFLQIRYEKERYRELVDESDAYVSYPFDTVRITMSDGYCYLWEDNSWLFDQEPGTEMILTDEQVKRLEDEPGVTKMYQIGSRCDENGNNITTIDFPEFINVDDISSVTIDGVECMK